MGRGARCGLLGVVLVLLWGRALLPGLWLDETVTAYVVKDGLGETFARASAFQGQYPLYYLIAWASRSIVGGSELALRLPSLVSLGVALLLLERVGARLVDAEVGRLAALFLACLAYHEASDARPYALATAAVVGAALAALRWGESPTPARAVVFALASAFVAYAHPLFALVWPGLVWLAVARSRTHAPAPGARAIGAVAVVGVAALVAFLLLPLAPQLLALHARRAQLSYSTPPVLRDLAFDMVRPRAVLALGLGLALAMVPRGARARGLAFCPPDRPASLALPLVAWHALPPLVLFAISRGTETQLYVARYLAATLPAFALLLAWLTRAIAPPRARALVAAVFVALSVAQYHDREDWRAAIAAVKACRPDPSTLVLIRTGLVESDDPAFADAPGGRDYLLAPLAAYPLDANGASLRLVPHSLVKATEPAFEELVALASRTPRTILVSRTNASVLGWLDHRLGVAGLTSTVATGDRERLRVVVYERR